MLTLAYPKLLTSANSCLLFSMLSYEGGCHCSLVSSLSLYMDSGKRLGLISHEGYLKRLNSYWIMGWCSFWMGCAIFCVAYMRYSFPDTCKRLNHSPIKLNASGCHTAITGFLLQNNTPNAVNNIVNPDIHGKYRLCTMFGLAAR